MTFFRPVVALTTLALLGAAPAADAATRLIVRGGGFGHGVGMSQYGALGFAQHGKGYREILGHYYTGTAIGRLDANPTVRVLLQSGRRTVTFAGASQAGDRRLVPTQTYRATSLGAGRVVLRSSTGHKLRTLPAPLRVVGSGGAPVRLVGGSNSGLYRGVLELTGGGGGLTVVDAVDLESYVRGVVAAESPSSWPAEALRAQAVAARTYAITTGHPGQAFDQYADTRSQVYRGVAAETAPSDAAVAATSREVVTYQGKPVTTYFFSTSGGRTENVEFGFPGGQPQPWLKSVDDPYDTVSPRHRWGPLRFTLAQAGAKLHGLVKGKLVGIDVVQRGRSPRVVKAVVRGTQGTTTVDGATLRTRLGLFDTWAYYNVIGTRVRPVDPPKAPKEPTAPQPDPGTGAVEARAAAKAVFDPWADFRMPRATPASRARAERAARAAERGPAVVEGRVTGVRRGARLAIERRTGGHWARVRTVHVRERGAYTAHVARGGTYRVRVSGLVGPTTTP